MSPEPEAAVESRDGGEAPSNGADPASPPDAELDRRVERALARMRARREVAEARMTPEPGEETATLADIAVTRDPETGHVEPLRRRTPIQGYVVRFLPLTYRDQIKYGLADRGLLELGDEERLEFLREHVVEPDLSELEDLEDIRFSVVEDLLMLIAASSRDRRWQDLPEPADEGGAAGKE